MSAAQQAKDNLTDNQSTYEKFFSGALCILPVAAMIMPRALTVLPAVAALLALALYRVYKGRWPRIEALPFIWVGVLLALMGASALWSVDAESSIERTMKTAPILLGGALLFSLARGEDGAYFRSWFPFAFLSACAAILIEFCAGAPFYHLVHERAAEGMEQNLFYLNRSVALLIIMAPLAVTCVSVSAFEKSFKWILYALFAASVAAVLYKTDSQSAQLAVIVGAFFYALYPARRRGAWVAAASVLGALVLAAPWIAQAMFHAIPAYAEGSSFVTRGSGLQRLEVWDFIARRALERPFHGHGVEATRAITDFDSAMLYHGTREAMHPHNFALQLWIEFGIWGPVFAAAFFAAVLRGTQKLEPLYARTSVTVLFTAVSVAATGYGLWQGMWIGAFGMLFAFCVLAANKKPAG
ncbi:MAG: O-antigen ligase family protein [Alphaproteobacteria bacterium]